MTAIAAGTNHTCALMGGGGVKCWGQNDVGELGNGLSGNYSIAPADVTVITATGGTKPLSGVSAIAAGFGYTCALTVGGGVNCWGYGSTTSSDTPADVVGLTSGVSAITAGYDYACALTSRGGVECWGSNADGQLGNGTNIDSSIPVDVVGLISGVTMIATGLQHTCALTDGGGVKCWGDNGFSELGNGSTTSSSTPVDVDHLASGVRMVSVGEFHSCALTVGGGVKCWGNNVDGQLGVGFICGFNVCNSASPVDVLGLASGVSSIAAGDHHTCALTVGGAVTCWGGEESGVFRGGGARIDSNIPVDVVGLASGVSAISASSGHICVLTSGGGVKCWGENQYGQLGDGTTTDRDTPVDVAFGSTGS